RGTKFPCFTHGGSVFSSLKTENYRTRSRGELARQKHVDVCTGNESGLCDVERIAPVLGDGMAFLERLLVREDDFQLEEVTEFVDVIQMHPRLPDQVQLADLLHDAQHAKCTLQCVLQSVGVRCWSAEIGRQSRLLAVRPVV